MVNEAHKNKVHTPFLPAAVMVAVVVQWWWTRLVKCHLWIWFPDFLEHRNVVPVCDSRGELVVCSHDMCLQPANSKYAQYNDNPFKALQRLGYPTLVMSVMARTDLWRKFYQIPNATQTAVSLWTTAKLPVARLSWVSTTSKNPFRSTILCTCLTLILCFQHKVS